MRNSIYLMFIFFTSMTYGQSILLKGLVVDTSGHTLQDINIFNRSVKTGTTTNVSGRFEIHICLNDTLEISSVQYIKRIKVISEIDLSSEMTIVLRENNRMLADIILIPYSSFLDTSFVKSKAIDLSLPFDNTLVKRPYIDRQYDVLKPKVQFVGIGIGASVLGSFTKEYKEIKKLKEIKKTDNYSKSLYTYFDQYFYTKTLEIPENNSVLFIDYCLRKEPGLIELLERKDIYTLINRLKHHSDGFKMKSKE